MNHWQLFIFNCQFLIISGMSILVIGIAGGTGSGKTTVVNKIIKRLAEKDVTILSQDA